MNWPFSSGARSLLLVEASAQQLFMGCLRNWAGCSFVILERDLVSSRFRLGKPKICWLDFVTRRIGSLFALALIWWFYPLVFPSSSSLVLDPCSTVRFPFLSFHCRCFLYSLSVQELSICHGFLPEVWPKQLSWLPVEVMLLLGLMCFESLVLSYLMQLAHLTVKLLQCCRFVCYLRAPYHQWYQYNPASTHVQARF